MAQKATFEDMLRKHDRALYEWLGTLRVDYGSIARNVDPQPDWPILRVMASPEFAFAEMRDLLIRKGWIKRPTQQELLDDAKAYKLVPLPIVSVTRESPEPDSSRAMVPGVYRGLTYNSATGMKENHPYPGTYIINYQLDFWMLKKYTAAYIYEWFMSYFGKLGAAPNEMFITVDHELPWGLKIQGTKLTSFADNSDLEGIEDQRRFIRYTASLAMNALLFRNPTEHKPFMSAEIKLYDSTYADAKTNLFGELISTFRHAPEINIFPDDGILHGPDVTQLFKVEGAATVARSRLTSDGRFGAFNTRPRNNEYGAYALTCVNPTDRVGCRPILFPTGAHPIAVRFSYLAPDEAGVFELLDDQGTVLQTWDLAVTAKWLQFETFVVVEGGFAVRWRMPVAGTFNLDRIRFVWVENVMEAPISPTSNTVVAGVRTIVFSGLDDQLGYIVSGKLLNTTTVYDIVIKNATAAPTREERIAVGGDTWEKFGVIMQPKEGTDEIVTYLEDVSDDVDVPEVRVYRGSLWGRFVEI